MKLKNITMIRNKIIYIGCLFIFFMEGYAQKIEPIPYNYHLYKKIDSSDVVSPFDEIEIASFVKRHKINKKGTINGVYITKDMNDNLLYKTQFTDGSGYWKDFYYESGNIKEEGKVENNCKVGEWKYYNKNGTIDSLKIYSIKDSVDVRFPHCLFNKNEPCY